MTDKPTRAKLAHLPGTRVDPEPLLHAVLEQVDKVENVLVITFSRDGSEDAAWSNMSFAELAYAEKFLSVKISEKLLELIDND
jgi:hypothetical protein